MFLLAGEKTVCILRLMETELMFSQWRVIVSLWSVLVLNLMFQSRRGWWFCTCEVGLVGLVNVQF